MSGDVRRVTQKPNTVAAVTLPDVCHSSLHSVCPLNVDRYESLKLISSGILSFS